MKGNEVMLRQVDLAKIINTQLTEYTIIERANGAISKFINIPS
jgi:hypothetical protein